jgi:hypothetical protein
MFIPQQSFELSFSPSLSNAYILHMYVYSWRGLTLS